MDAALKTAKSKLGMPVFDLARLFTDCWPLSGRADPVRLYRPPLVHAALQAGAMAVISNQPPKYRIPKGLLEILSRVLTWLFENKSMLS